LIGKNQLRKKKGEFEIKIPQSLEKFGVLKRVNDSIFGIEGMKTIMRIILSQFPNETLHVRYTNIDDRNSRKSRFTVSSILEVYPVTDTTTSSETKEQPLKGAWNKEGHVSKGEGYA